jgi:hypothetical protein
MDTLIRDGATIFLLEEWLRSQPQCTDCARAKIPRAATSMDGLPGSPKCDDHSLPGGHPGRISYQDDSPIRGERVRAAERLILKLRNDTIL